MVTWMHAGHRRFRSRGPRVPAYIVVLCVEWPGLERLQELVAQEVGLSLGQRFFPHITLCGPLSLQPGADIVALLDRAVRSLSLPRAVHPVDLHLFRGKRGLAVSLLLREDPALTAFARAVSNALVPFYKKCNAIDRPPSQRILHVSVAVNLPRKKGEFLFSELSNPRGKLGREAERLFRETPPRVTRMALVRRGALWKGYDPFRKEWMGRGGLFGTGNATER
jgi:hypothetical protein